ncbi:MAG: trypsin-like peptidase domain-containing protein, partial [Calditrichia bacterium]
MKKVLILLILLAAAVTALAGVSPKDIYKQYRETICLITYYQNIASDSRIGSFNKIKRHRIGILVSADGLVMASSDIYPVSLDMVSGANSMLSGKPSDFKIKLSDGTEYPAEFLGKDDQAQTALIRLKDLPQDKKFAYVSFVSTEKYGVADSVYCLELLPQYYDFQPLFTPHLINAVIESPRRKFLINNYTTGLSAGGLVLDSQGRAIGMTLGQDIDFIFHPPTEFEELRKDYLEIAPSEWFTEFIQNPPESENDQTGQKAWLGIRMQGLSRELQAYWKVPQSGGIIINKV